MKKLLILIPVFAFVAAIFGCGPSTPILRVYSWSDYISPEVVAAFEKEYNCKVMFDIFSSNEMLYSKMKTNGGRYDLITPSSYMARLMYEKGMLMELDHGLLPNIMYVDKNYLSQKALDKTMQYSVPYMLSYTCIAYDGNRIKNPEQSWNIFADPVFQKQTSLLDDVRELIGAALKANGYSMNSIDDAELAKARETLFKWRDNASTLDSEVYKQGIASGEFAIVQGYSGDLLQVAEDMPNIMLLFPREGLSIAVDDWAIPSNAQNIELAHAFINFMSRPEVAVANMVFSKYDAVNWKAREIMPDSIRHLPTMNIPQEILQKSEVIIDLGSYNDKYNEIWDEVKM